MDYTDLEDEITEAIQRCCPTERDKKEALRYFEDSLITDMIEEAFEE